MSTLVKGMIRSAGWLALAMCVSCVAPVHDRDQPGSSDTELAAREEALSKTASLSNPEIVEQQLALSHGQISPSTLPFSVGMDLGVGLDVTSQTVLSQARCLDLTGNESEIESHSYATEIVKYNVVRDKSELRQLLDISAKMSGIIGALRLGIEAQYYDEIIRDENSVYLLVSLDLLTRTYSLKHPTMTLDGFDGLDERADNHNGSVPNTIRNYFATDYDEFRKKCGDRYLDGVVTGGRYIAVLEIKTTNRFDKNLIAGQLEGTYLPFMITVRGKLELMLEKLHETHQVKVHVVSRGDNRADTVVSLQSLDGPTDATVPDLVDDLNRFRQEVIAADANASTSAFGYRRSAMYALFGSYEQTTLLDQGPDPQERLDAMGAYAEAFEDYELIERDAADVLLRPARYQVADDMLVELTQREAQLSQNALELASQRCALARDPTCQPVASLGLSTPQALRGTLPLPLSVGARDCREVRELRNDYKDGEKEVYLGGRFDRPFALYCSGMAGEEPVNYLSG
jgi:hypothetical protein